MFLRALHELVLSSGLANLTVGEAVMVAVGCVLLYLGIVRGYEPLLLVPIGFGVILANMPLGGVMEPGGFLHFIYQGVKSEVFPLLIFVGIGALTDFGPLIANPSTLFLGAAAQLGVFITFLGALFLGFTSKQAASIGIIGGADGPTTIFLASKLAPELLGPVAIAAYSYMALVPLIQPPVMRALTTKQERMVVMRQLRPVSKLERICFPIAVTLVSGLLIPTALPLIGTLMFGNLLREVQGVGRLLKTAQNELLNTVTMFLGLGVGASTNAKVFLTPKTIFITLLGLAAFAVSTAGGILLGKLMFKLTRGKVNPLIGSAGVSAVPMAARVSHIMAQKENPRNFLLMHAMGPNVAGVIGTAAAAGALLSLFR